MDNVSRILKETKSIYGCPLLTSLSRDGSEEVSGALGGSPSAGLRILATV